ncbi:hypothetical protein HK405_014205 [Cladochytrium tenue]|nr:hypothetical protein HK405_014205 [Cladochytrium tenue]
MELGLDDADNDPAVWHTASSWHDEVRAHLVAVGMPEWPPPPSLAEAAGLLRIQPVSHDPSETYVPDVLALLESTQPSLESANIDVTAARSLATHGPPIQLYAEHSIFPERLVEGPPSKPPITLRDLGSRFSKLLMEPADAQVQFRVTTADAELDASQLRLVEYFNIKDTETDQDGEKELTADLALLSDLMRSCALSGGEERIASATLDEFSAMKIPVPVVEPHDPPELLDADRTVAWWLDIDTCEGRLGSRGGEKKRPRTTDRFNRSLTQDGPLQRAIREGFKSGPLDSEVGPFYGMLAYGTAAAFANLCRLMWNPVKAMKDAMERTTGQTIDVTSPVASLKQRAVASLPSPPPAPSVGGIVPMLTSAFNGASDSYSFEKITAWRRQGHMALAFAKDPQAREFTSTVDHSHIKSLDELAPNKRMRTVSPVPETSTDLPASPQKTRLPPPKSRPVSTSFSASSSLNAFMKLRGKQIPNQEAPLQRKLAGIPASVPITVPEVPVLHWTAAGLPLSAARPSTRHLYVAGTRAMRMTALRSVLEKDYLVDTIERDYGSGSAAGGSISGFEHPVDVDFIIDEKTCALIPDLPPQASLASLQPFDAPRIYRTLVMLSHKFERVHLLLDVSNVDPTRPPFQPPGGSQNSAAGAPPWSPLPASHPRPTLLTPPVLGGVAWLLAFTAEAGRRAGCQFRFVWVDSIVDLASTIRAIGDGAASAYVTAEESAGGSVGHAHVSAEPAWDSRAAWECRNWVSHEESTQERFLCSFPALNALSAQLVLSQTTLGDFIHMDVRGKVALAGRWIRADRLAAFDAMCRVPVTPPPTGPVPESRAKVVLGGFY